MTESVSTRLKSWPVEIDGSIGPMLMLWTSTEEALQLTLCPSSPNGYLVSELQERLLYTEDTGHDIQGESTVDLQVQNTLFMFGAMARGRALQERRTP